MEFGNWKWLNKSSITISKDGINLWAPAQTDWFRNPIQNSNGEFDKPVANAPFFYTECSGDFVFCAKVKPNHKDKFDACSLMIIENDTLWIKLAFETTDLGNNAIVCVVTDNFSDDAVGCDITQDFVWLKIVRKGNSFSTHYSLDGRNFHMVRLFRIVLPETVKVGLEAQCPVGNGGNRLFSNITLENKSVDNLKIIN